MFDIITKKFDMKNVRAIPIDMVVSPYVFLVEKRPHLTINYEVADTVWIPLSYFADLRNRSSLQYSIAGKTVSLPCFRYSEEKVVWGMTLKMIDEFCLLITSSSCQH